MSSPAPVLPSSSAGGAYPSSSAPAGSRPGVDPNAFDNIRGLQGSHPADEAEEADETGGGGGGRRRGGRSARTQNVDDIPRVKDTTGEKVMESFQVFLEK